MKLRIPADYLPEAQRVRAPGFAAAVEAIATRDGDKLVIAASDWHRLTLDFMQPQPARGLGDLVAAVATPIARAFHLSCIDPATNQLRPDSGCAQRRDRLNRLGQATSRRLSRSP
jgi:hypothetical protein